MLCAYNQSLYSAVFHHHDRFVLRIRRHFLRFVLWVMATVISIVADIIIIIIIYGFLAVCGIVWAKYSAFKIVRFRSKSQNTHYID